MLDSTESAAPHIDPTPDPGPPPIRAPRVLDAVDPSTRQLIAQVYVSTPAQMAAQVARARDAAKRWGALAPAARAAALGQLRRVVAAHADEIADTISRGMGKPLIEALSLEAGGVLDTLDACIARTSAPGDLAPTPGRYADVLRSLSLGSVVCVIAPLSAPFELALTPAVIALAAGHAVVIKTSSSVPLVGLLIERLIAAAWPATPDLVQVVIGASDIGGPLARAGGIDAVLFAGSAATGRRLATDLAAMERPAHVRVGGADVAIVCSDANLERAANAIVFGRFANNGQDCASIKRVYVQHDVADVLIHKVKHKVRALKSGPFGNPFCELGPLANARHLEQTRAVLQDALDQRAVLVTGGFPDHVTGPRHGERRGAEQQGWYWPATVLSGVERSMRVTNEPLFAPVLPIQIFEDDAAVLRLANDTTWSFDACVFTADVARAEALAKGLRAGAVVVNDIAPQGAAPWVTGELRQGGTADREPHWFPYSAAKLAAVEAALQARRDA